MFGPIIHGTLISLVPPQSEYLASYVRWFADTDVTRHLLLRNPPSLQQEATWFERVAGSQEDIVWAIVLNEGERLIGNTGLHQINWRHRHAHSGIMIGEKDQWGKGYASEAMRLRTAYAFHELGLEKILTSVYADNHGSRRALEKAGYRQCGLLRRQRYYAGTWHDEWMGEILRDEWEQAQSAEA
jgi:RimJ/RimL family protein N-acetyltransferase